MKIFGIFLLEWWDGKTIVNLFVLKAEDSLYFNFQIAGKTILYDNGEEYLEGEQMTCLVMSIFLC